MPKYKKKPIVIEAIRWQGGDYSCLDDFCGRNWSRADVQEEEGPQDGEGVVVWNTMEKQWINLPVGHWLIRGIQGELYSCEDGIFRSTYEEV